jgi:hypothetical protein
LNILHFDYIFFSFNSLSKFRLHRFVIKKKRILFLSDSIDINNNEHESKLPRRITRHYTSIKSNISRHRKKSVTPIEYIPDEIPSNRRQIKQLRNDFIQKWAHDARNIYAQNHIIRSPNTYSDQMTNVDFIKTNRHRQKSTHHRRHRRSISSSSVLNKSNTSSSSSLFNQAQLVFHQ